MERLEGLTAVVTGGASGIGRAMVGGNAARVYGFDLDALAPVAARVGPLVEEVAQPLPVGDIPDEALRCPAFALAAASR